MPEISVVMGTYNEKNRKYTAKAIDSILHQTFADFEFIIYDDGSEIEFYEWLKKYCKKDTRIKLLHSRKNRGPAYARNACLKQAKGHYIAIMDADDISDDERFKEQLSFLQRHPKYAVVGCSARLIDGSKVWGMRIVEQKPDKKSFLHSLPFVHPSIMLRKEVMDELQGYAQAAAFYRVEDYDLLMRLYAGGYRGYNLSKILFSYREDARAYKKRSYQCRMNECRVRYAGFRRLGILHGNFRYVIKPLVIGCIPSCIMRSYRTRKFAACSNGNRKYEHKLFSMDFTGRQK